MLPQTTDPEGVVPRANTTLPLDNAGVVFDTGAGRMSVPSDLIDDVYFNLGWNVTKLLDRIERMECQHLNASWAVILMLGESADQSEQVSFSIRGDEFIREGEQCVPPLDNSGQPGFALFGTQFMRRHYSVVEFGADKPEDYQPRTGLEG